MHLIVGLGNPGEQYENTRHNVGFHLVEQLGERHGITLSKVRHRARFGRGNIGGQPVLLAQPLTFMNLSGEATKALMAYHGCEVGDLVVAHDEADLEPGEVRLKDGGGIAGHNGLRSLVQHLGTRDFVRLRIGIGRPPGRQPLEDYVLRAPKGEQRELLEVGIRLAADAVERVLADGTKLAMNEVNRRAGGG